MEKAMAIALRAMLMGIVCSVASWTPAKGIKLVANEDGSFRVFNGRTKQGKQYR